MLQVAFSGLYFDSKIDTIEKMVNGSQVKKKESHYTIIAQPGDELVGFCVSTEGTGNFLNFHLNPTYTLVAQEVIHTHYESPSITKRVQYTPPHFTRPYSSPGPHLCVFGHRIVTLLSRKSLVKSENR